MPDNVDRLPAHLDKLFIGGQWVTPSGTGTIKVINPTTEEVFVEVAMAETEDMDRAIAAAREAFDNGPWPRMSHVERAKYLHAFAAEMRRRGEALWSSWVSEVGVTATIAQAFMSILPDNFDYHADLAFTYPWIERQQPKMSPGSAIGYLVREPVGVVGAILPWNGAVAEAGWKIAPALIAGCTVILKASPESPAGPLLLAEVAEAVGLPDGVLNVLTAERDVSEYLVRHPGVDKISFTGSGPAGKRIGAICGERIARCTLELGGKSAGIILDDYDVEEAARRIASYAIMLTGQACSSLTRLIVPRPRHDAFAEAMGAAFSKVKLGDPFDLTTEMGPLATRNQRDRIEGYIAKGKNEGADLVQGGKRPANINRGFFVEPTIFANVHNDMTIAREEIFGPVLSIIPADNEEHAIEIANDTPFGLNASIFTNDSTKAFHLSRRLFSGTVGQNWWRSDYSIGFGGFKQSGIGRAGGLEGLRPFLESKTVILESEPLGVIV